MAFRATLVAFGENAAAAPFLGHQFTEIAISEPSGADASNPSAVGIQARDRIIEATDGQDTAVTMRKMTDVEFAIDYVTAATKARLERLFHDGRPVYFCPNVGPSTRWSFPLQRGLADFAGRKTLTNARNAAAYFWDAAEKVFRSWAAYDSAIDFNGKWTRYLRTAEGYANKASYPHPTSTGHGWSITTGTGALTYSEDVDSPVLQQRTVANQRGVVLGYFNAGAAATVVIDSTATLSTTNAVVASLCLAWQGLITVLLAPTGGGTAAYAGQFYGDGTFQLLKFGGVNAAASNQYRISIIFGETGAKKQSAIFGPTMIANYKATSGPDLEDWNNGTVDSDDITQSDTVKNAITDFTFSCFFKWPTVRAGIVVIGNDIVSVQKSSTDTINLISGGAASPMSWTNVRATLGAVDGWTTGDWIHLVVRGSATGGLCLFINGRAHALNGTEPWEPSDTDYRVRLGSAYGDFLCDSGLSHARLDAVAWSQQEITDHYHTYFEDRGRGIVEPAFGKVYAIDELRLSPRGSSPVQWVGALRLRELGADARFAPMLRQEGDV
jgi:hypothetical protein